MHGVIYLSHHAYCSWHFNVGFFLGHKYDTLGNFSYMVATVFDLHIFKACSRNLKM